MKIKEFNKELEFALSWKHDSDRQAMLIHLCSQIHRRCPTKSTIVKRLQEALKEHAAEHRDPCPGSVWRLQDRTNSDFINSTIVIHNDAVWMTSEGSVLDMRYLQNRELKNGEILRSHINFVEDSKYDRGGYVKLDYEII